MIKKHQFITVDKISHCIYCERVTSLQPHDQRTLPEQLAECQNGKNSTLIESALGIYNCNKQLIAIDIRLICYKAIWITIVATYIFLDSKYKYSIIIAAPIVLLALEIIIFEIFG